MKKLRYLPDRPAADREFEKIDSCGDRVFEWTHYSCGAKWTVKESCDSRWCPECARKRADRLVRRYLPGVDKFRYPALLTLTVPNCELVDLSLYLTVLSTAFQRLRRMKVWSGGPGLYAFEIKYGEKGLHPHIHCITDWKWCDLQELSLAWRNVCEKLFLQFGRFVEVLHQPDIKPVKPASLVWSLGEVVKYATGAKRGKGAQEYQGYPETVKFHVAACLSKSRMAQPFGGLKAVKEEKAEMRCPRCGALYMSNHYYTEWNSELVTKAESHRRKYGCGWNDYYKGWILEYKEAG